MDYFKWKELAECTALKIHIPRKLRKKIVGQRLNRSSRIRLFKKGEFHFCPVCGCMQTYTVNHGVAYPEIWVEDKCVNCNNIIISADNSCGEYLIDGMDLDEFKEYMN